jgi:hypothetical protein
MIEPERHGRVLTDTMPYVHWMRHGEKITVVEDSLPAGRNDRRFAARLQPGASRSGRLQDVG